VKSLVVAIVGPTAAGKTELSMLAAWRLSGEIISADSRQVYRGMDVGTAKATPEQRAGVRHHLIDVVAPDRVLSLAEYQQMAMDAIGEVAARGHLPLLVGGTGQYVSAVLEGWRIPAVPPDPALRSRLEADVEAQGPAALHARLSEVDPAAAARIDYRNVRRVIRALEVCLVAGRPISALQTKEPPPFEVVKMGLTWPRSDLYARIDARVDRMIELGLVDEVERLAEAGYDWQLTAMTGLGYRQIGQYLRGEVSLEEAVALIKRQTRRLVQQQYNWFGLDDPAIEWMNLAETSFEGVLVHLTRLLDRRAG